MEAYTSVAEHFHAHYEALEFIEDGPETDRVKAAAMLDYVAGLPGFGLVKAGFVIQLAYGLAGCLDTHNLTRLGLKEHTFEHYKRLGTAKGRRNKVSSYLDAIAASGGCGALWDDWCKWVADRQPTRWANAEAVSRIHCDAFNI